ncbi:MAG: PIG-L family deacetylase, partial [Candidatus Sumerlaeia bacterium]|nr:PIG-L family deacetylase [Candidatus Sumerlaeia bacterium]
GQPSRRIKNLAAVRRRELEAAARLLGAVVFHGGFGDGELADTYSARRVVIEIVRRFAPTLLLAHSPADYHADHRAASSLAEAASWFCASPGHKTASPSLPAPPALWWMDTVNMTGFEPVFFVNVTDYLDLKRNMLACHRSQMQRSGESGFGPLMEQMLLQATTRGAQAGVRAAEAFQPYAGWKRGRAW